VTEGGTQALDPGWVDEVLLAGPAADPCVALGAPVSREALRQRVADRQAALTGVGLRAGGTVALCLPPSPAFISNLLAVWRIGAQAILLDHRLTPFEMDRALDYLAPQAVVSAARAEGAALRGFTEVREQITARPGRPAAGPHALVQLSSGSTGPSKVIGRTAADLIAEIGRYARIDAVPRGGERIVSLASMVHVLGLVGGLLYSLNAGVLLEVPQLMTPRGILETVAADPSPATLLGVPYHIELLTSVAAPPPLPQLSGMTTGGEPVRGAVYEAFVNRYGVRLGNMYGMTEVGVIATDLFGADRPALRPAPGLTVREAGGELHIAVERAPYLRETDPSRWSGGWLHTRDAGTVDPRTGLVRVLGRRDSQVSVGGLKVDLTEVEHTLADLPEVQSAVVVFDRMVEAYLTLREPGALARVENQLTERLAAYKRPRVFHVVERLPRTATGKLVRDRAALREASRASEADLNPAL
jgi:3-hydroxy-4-methylanthranilate adenylyltransferase